MAPNSAVLEGGVSGRYKVKELSETPFGEDDFKFTSSQIWTVYPDGSFQTHLSPELANVKLTHVFKQSADVDKSGNRIGNLQQMSVNPVVLYDEKGERLHLLVRTQNVMAVKRLQQAAAALSWPAGTVKPPSGMLFLATMIKKPEQYAAIIDALRAELNLDPAQCERAKVEAEQLLRGKLIAS
jgi:hypothetical protein